MANARRPRFILICGLPGAGKTTLARRLAQDSSAVRLGADEWVAGLGIDPHDERARGRLELLLVLYGGFLPLPPKLSQTVSLACHTQ